MQRRDFFSHGMPCPCVCLHFWWSTAPPFHLGDNVSLDDGHSRHQQGSLDTIKQDHQQLHSRLVLDHIKLTSLSPATFCLGSREQACTGTCLREWPSLIPLCPSQRDSFGQTGAWTGEGSSQHDGKWWEETRASRGKPTQNIQTPHRKDLDINPGPSCCEATVLTNEPSFCPKGQVFPSSHQVSQCINPYLCHTPYCIS